MGGVKVGPLHCSNSDHPLLPFSKYQETRIQVPVLPLTAVSLKPVIQPSVLQFPHL